MYIVHQSEVMKTAFVMSEVMKTGFAPNLAVLGMQGTLGHRIISSCTKRIKTRRNASKTGK